MKKVHTGFWGKLEKDGEGRVLLALPLVDHCADVAACCEGLLGRELIRHRLARLGELTDLDPVQQQRLCAIAALHDIGKFNYGFQNKAFDYGLKAGHVKEALHLFVSDLGERVGSALDFDAMSTWSTDSDTVCRILFASICHHGRPHSTESDGLLAPFWKNQNGKDPFAGIAELTTLLKAWFPAAWQRGSALPEAPAFQHAFSGFVTLADWLASDVRFFPLRPDNPFEARITFARKQVTSLLEHMGIDAAKPRMHLARCTKRFFDVFGYDPRDIQRRMELLPVSPEGSLTIMEAPTGAGKTEAAVARYLVLFAQGLVDGLYFALPTRTAATQIYGRICKYIERAFPDEDTRPPVTLAVPGYLSVDDVSGHRLSKFEVLWDDDDTMKRRYRGWASENSKRYLAGSIVVGTIDQVLLSRLAVSHSHLRAAALLRHLLVIDEVHASDTYMTQITMEVLKYHLKAGAHALLMSATLGGTVREKLMWPDRVKRSCPAHSECEAERFPLIVHRDLNSGELIRIAPEAPRSFTVRAELRDAMTDPMRVAREAFNAAIRGARVLVIRNTVGECLRTQISLERIAGAGSNLLFCCEGTAAPHHARFSREDRNALDRSIEAGFGINRPTGGMVAIATQTVQQSLDLDADLVISDLCPIDVLLQRIGRLHRHQNVRPDGFESPVVVVLVPEQFDLGLYIDHKGRARGPSGMGSVYEDLCILEATWQLLRERPEFAIPADSRKLVERALHPDILETLASQRGHSWIDHRNQVWGTHCAERRQADLNLANWEAPFGEIETLFPKDVGIATRLGEGDRWVHFEEPFIGPFGKKIDLLTLPAYLARDLPDDASPSGIEAHNGMVRFSIGEKGFVYDRLGLRSATLDQNLRDNPSETQDEQRKEEDGEI